MPDCVVHYLWFAFVCFLIRSHPPNTQIGWKTHKEGLKYALQGYLIILDGQNIKKIISGNFHF